MNILAPRFRFFSFLLLLTGHGFHAATAGELCATVTYEQLDMYSPVNSLKEDPVERLIRIRFDRNKYLTTVWGEICAEMHRSSGQPAVDECVAASGYVRPIKNWQENEVVSQGTENGGLELSLDQRADFWGDLAKTKCKGEPDNAKRRLCELKAIMGDTFIPLSDLRSQVLQSEELQDVEIQHVMRLPFNRDVGPIETRVVLQGTESTDTAVLHGHFAVVKCPDESREDRNLDKRMNKEIKRLTSK